MRAFQQPLFLRILGLAAVIAISAAAASGDPRYFRSDHGIAGPDVGHLPDTFDTAGALAWRVSIDPGHSSPILFNGKVFLTTWNAGSKELAAEAFDARTGQRLWRQPITTPRIEQTHAIGSPATATPACDGERLFVFFGSYGLVCYDLNGKRLWENPMGPFQDEYGAGSSPIVIDGKVILNQDHDIGSFLAAFDGATGKLAWKAARPEAVRSYSTPATWIHDGRKELLVAGALELAGYDPANGEKRWWVNGLARIVIPVPVPSGEVIYMASWTPGGDSGRRLALDPWPAAIYKWDRNHDGKLAKAEIDDREVLERFFRMDLDQSGDLNQKEWDRHAEVFQRAQNALLAVKPVGRGELNENTIAWKHPRGVPYVATPLFSQGAVWMVKDGGIVNKLEATTGRVLHEERLPGIGNYFASPVTGDGKVYFESEAGVASVVADSSDWKVISSHDFHEKIYATPAMERGRIYIRTEKALYCFGATAAAAATTVGTAGVSPAARPQ
jgi:outer membrane protein assembly factor BamB